MAGMVDDILEALAAHAMRRLERSVGDRSLCQVSRDDSGGDEPKRAEGRFYAIRGLRRSVRGADAAVARTIAEAHLADARRALEAEQAKQRPSRSWQAYHEGQVEGLQEAAMALADPAVTPTTSG